MSRWLMQAVLAVVVTLGAAGYARAATITAFEEIGDSTCSPTSLTSCADETRDLYRIRQIGAGPPTVENTDAAITAAVGSGGNDVNAAFGIYTDADVAYTQVLSWLPTTTFTTAVLTIMAYDVNGQNDVVLGDSIDLGTLVQNNNGISTSSYSSALFPNILVQLQDGLLAVLIQKSNNDDINVFSSRLTVTFEEQEPQPSAVPEPASLLLLGVGLASLAARRRRQSA